jgi:hypothetical protein
MKDGFRMVIWASVGLLVSAGWGFYFAAANKDIPIGPIVNALVGLTQPAVALVVHFNPDSLLGLRAVAIANAVTYALIGLIVETIRRRSQILHIPN